MYIAFQLAVDRGANFVPFFLACLVVANKANRDRRKNGRGKAHMSRLARTRRLSAPFLVEHSLARRLSPASEDDSIRRSTKSV